MTPFWRSAKSLRVDPLQGSLHLNLSPYLSLEEDFTWVRGVMILDVGWEFRDQGSIPRECQIPSDADLGQVNFTIASVASS